MNIKSFFNQSIRVWKLLRKHSSEEFKTVAKVSAIGVAILGLLGFIVSMIVTAFF